MMRVPLPQGTLVWSQDFKQLCLQPNQWTEGGSTGRTHMYYGTGSDRNQLAQNFQELLEAAKGHPNFGPFSKQENLFAHMQLVNVAKASTFDWTKGVSDPYMHAEELFSRARGDLFIRAIDYGRIEVRRAHQKASGWDRSLSLLTSTQLTRRLENKLTPEEAEQSGANIPPFDLVRVLFRSEKTEIPENPWDSWVDH